MENPSEYREELRDSEDVYVLATMSVNEVIGPYYFGKPIGNVPFYLYLLKN